MSTSKKSKKRATPAGNCLPIAVQTVSKRDERQGLICAISHATKKTVRSIVLGGRSLSYECVRKKIKNVNIRIRPDGSLSVSAPNAAPYYRIEEILRLRQDFILRAMDNALAREREKLASYACDEGARIPLLGKEYTLRIADRGTSRIEGDILILSLRKTEDPEKRKEALKRFAEKTLADYVTAEFAKIHPLFSHAAPMPSLKLRLMRARWGSCRPKTAVITLNTRLAFYPTAYIDYVIMHEFTHFLHGNHSSAFWDALAERMPDWAERRKELNASPMAEWF